LTPAWSAAPDAEAAGDCVGGSLTVEAKIESLDDRAMTVVTDDRMVLDRLGVRLLVVSWVNVRQRASKLYGGSSDIPRILLRIGLTSSLLSGIDAWSLLVDPPMPRY
jgi:hypothetical protein